MMLSTRATLHLAGASLRPASSVLAVRKRVLSSKAPEEDELPPFPRLTPEGQVEHNLEHPVFPMNANLTNDTQFRADLNMNSVQRALFVGTTAHIAVSGALTGLGYVLISMGHMPHEWFNLTISEHVFHVPKFYFAYETQRLLWPAKWIFTGGYTFWSTKRFRKQMIEKRQQLKSSSPTEEPAYPSVSRHFPGTVINVE